MGKSLYTYLAERLSRCRLNVGRYGLCYLIRRMLKWTKMIVRDFLNFLKKLKSKPVSKNIDWCRICACNAKATAPIKKIKVFFPIVLSVVLKTLAAISREAVKYRKIDKIGCMPIINNFSLPVSVFRLIN